MRRQRLAAAAVVSVAAAAMSILVASPANAATSIECHQGGGKVGHVIDRYGYPHPVCHGGTLDGKEVFVIPTKPNHVLPHLINVMN